MTKPKSICYMAHPVAPFTVFSTFAFTVSSTEDNLRNARRWLKALQDANPTTVVIAPWITMCEIYDDADPEARAIGLSRDCFVVAKCDAIILVGGRISNGMQIEADHAQALNMPIYDLTHLGYVPPSQTKIEATAKLGIYRLGL